MFHHFNILPPKMYAPRSEPTPTLHGPEVAVRYSAGNTKKGPKLGKLSKTRRLWASGPMSKDAIWSCFICVALMAMIVLLSLFIVYWTWKPVEMNYRSVHVVTDGEMEMFRAIEKLISTAHGNPGDVMMLQQAGVYTCNGLLILISTGKITGGLTKTRVDHVCEDVENIMNSGYITATRHLAKRNSVIHITTGSKAIDELLGGGLESMAITEGLGEYRSRNELAYTLCVSAQLHIDTRGGYGKVAYIDGTEGIFRPDRIIPIAERFGMDPRAVLDNIIYAGAYSYEHQYDLVLGLEAKMAQEPSAFRLVIVGSVPARGEFADHQQRLHYKLMDMARKYNIAIYINNHVTVDLKKPAELGASPIRLLFSDEQSFSKVFHGQKLDEAIFQISPGGVADAMD